MCFCEKFNFSDRFLTVSGNCAFFLSKKSSGFSKLHPTCPQEHIKEKIFCKVNFLYQSRTLSKKNFGLLSKNFRPVFHNCISHVFWNLWRKTFFCETFCCSFRFRTLSEIFSTFSRIFFVGLSQLHPTCPQEHLVED